jgi:hypothetical protein
MRDGRREATFAPLRSFAERVRLRKLPDQVAELIQTFSTRSSRTGGIDGRQSEGKQDTVITDLA